ncbi:NOB1 family endonuclease [Thermogladius calderae]|nr:nucleotide-binding protein [Thermogladius calderae]
MYSLREHSTNKVAIVGDTGALLARIYYMLPSYRFDFYTTSICVGEVKDQENREALLKAVDLGLVKVVEPGSEYLRKATDAARIVGELSKVSEADLSVIALALKLSQETRVVVLTDDYSVQNVLYQLGIGFKPVRTSGIKSAFKYREYCPTCGYVPGRPGEKVCPVCGSPIVRVRVS